MKETPENTYFSIQGSTRSELKIKRSLFVCSLKYVETAEQAKSFISRVSREHKTATHNCWAYIVGSKGETCHASDAGEPPGTAGRPMLNALHSCAMTNAAAVVTRYFGGVKLGIKGLIDAYSRSVKSAVDSGKLKRVVDTRIYIIEVSYPFNATLCNHLKAVKGRFVKSDYSAAVTHKFEVEEADRKHLDALLRNFQKSGWLNYDIPGKSPDRVMKTQKNLRST